MLRTQVHESLKTLAASLATKPDVAPRLHDFWRSRLRDAGAELAPPIREAAELVDRALPTLTRTSSAARVFSGLFDEPAGEATFAWAASSLDRRDARLSSLFSAGLAHSAYRARTLALAPQRIEQGPLADALACAPLLGDGTRFREPQLAPARARLEVLIWEAGAAALAFPDLGAWLWDDEHTFEEFVGRPACGSLRGRVLAARCLEICARGLPEMADPNLVGRTLQILQPLLLHPEPLVSTHAARALGRLAGGQEHLQGTLLDWVQGPSPVLRERAMTAFASLPESRLRVLGHELQATLEQKSETHWTLAAAAAGTPYLFSDGRELWDGLEQRILRGEGGPPAARALAQGLAVLWRRGVQHNAIAPSIHELRDVARRAKAGHIHAWRDWLQVLAATDPVDGAERDPLDVELGIENLVHQASQYDDEEADARAVRFASSLHRTFDDAADVVLGHGSTRHRASAMNALEGCARSLALHLWRPQLDSHPRDEPVLEPDMRETWNRIARAPTEMLDVLRERHAESGQRDEISLALEVLAVRLGSYALDACDQEHDLGPGRGPSAHATCLWLRKIEGVADGSRDLPADLRSALSAVFWRLVDITRGTALGAVDDVKWLGPFAAWWAMVIDRPTMLRQLGTALPMLADGALDTCCEWADAIRSAVASGKPDGRWGGAAHYALEKLHAHDTELAQALHGLAEHLREFAHVSGQKPDLEPSCLRLVLAAERLQFALADPVKALHPADTLGDDTPMREATENAPRIAGTLARAIRTRELGMVDVWFASLGPTTSGLVEQALRAAISRTPPPPPSLRPKAPQTVGGYEIVRQLGEGGIGKIWLVRKADADRLFVLKIPKADALMNASDTEREGILTSFHEEARALAGLYHPNVANIIDRGVAEGIPYLVLELLIGADLKQYATAKLLSLFELRQVTLDTCAGLSALHGAGLVHRDIKPANIWLRLPLEHGATFDGAKHRDPARTQPLAAVVIDFGMVRAMRVSTEAAGRFVAGTPGYIAPEQVLDPVELDGRADLYSLAGTIYNVTTGRAFFDEIENPRERIFAHMRREPFEDASLLAAYPAAVAKLMRAATALKPEDRPLPMEFGREFAACL